MFNYLVSFVHDDGYQMRPIKVKARNRTEAVEAAELALRVEVETLEAFDRWRLHSVNRTEP